MTMWQNIEDWNAWKTSDTRQANEAEFKDYIVGETEFEYYSLGLQME